MLKKLCLISAFALSPLFVSADSLTPEILALADSGVKAVYALDFNTAEANINHILGLYPNYPLALFGKTMIE